MSLFMFVIIVFYFLPWIVATFRHHNNRSAIAALNLFLGWTVLGWIGAFVWAYTDNVRKA